MFSVEPERFFVKLFAGWCLFTMFAVSSVVLNFTLLIVPAVVGVLALTYWTVECAFRTERFSTYVTLRLFYSLSVTPMVAFVLLLALMHKHSQSTSLLSVSISCVPLLVTAVAYVWVGTLKNKRSPLVVRGQRVEVIEVEWANNTLLGGASAVIGSLLFPVFQVYNIAYALLLIVLIAVSLYMVLSNKANISALRALKQQEARDRCHYTFMNIEEIREKRAASLLGRIFAVRAGR
ncbi:hypothetical protein [Pseudomonas sp. UM16]|uniref:hypothetical protein n=1 Tax=Pseudomonas sp. UM16 TaxID=3158962 RepID=UPI00398FF3C7